MLTTLKKLAGQIGNLRELVQLLEKLWQDDPVQFETVIAESTTDWSRYERLPLALRVLITERDDSNLRQMVRKICGTSRTNSAEKMWLCFVAALWGDQEARQVHNENVSSLLKKAARSTSPQLFNDLFWALRRAAMLNPAINAEDLEHLTLRFQQRQVTHLECAGMVDALLVLQRQGFKGLSQAVELSLSKKRVSDTDLGTCFVLGATGDAVYAPLFLKVYRDSRGTDFWGRGLKRCALTSYAYATLPGESLLRVLEQELVQKEKQITGWWKGDALTAEFMAMCAILWNFKPPLSQDVLDTLVRIATGSHKENAKSSIALLLLKGVELPSNIPFDRDAFQIKFARDFLQYDSVLDFAYYWRCRVKRMSSS